jgi:hypothetical protein
MKFCIVTVDRINHQTAYTNYMRKGLLKQGLVEETNRFAPDIDFFITWAWKPTKTGLHWEWLSKQKQPKLIMERGFLGDRMEWTSCGWNGLNGRGNYCNNTSDLSRWNTHFTKYIKPWKNLENLKKLPVLVVGQVSHDASVQHVNINNWYTNTIKTLVEMGEKVIFREHPLNRSPYYGKAKGDSNEKLETTLEQVKAVVSFSSNSGVISFLNGIPTIATDEGSMIYRHVKHDLTNLEFCPDRTQWQAEISYTQWTSHEIEDGHTFEHLKAFLQ